MLAAKQGIASAGQHSVIHLYVLTAVLSGNRSWQYTGCPVGGGFDGAGGFGKVAAGRRSMGGASFLKLSSSALRKPQTLLMPPALSAQSPSQNIPPMCSARCS